MGYIVINMVGEKYGRLKVVKRSKKPYKHGALWTCLCDCGNKVDVSRQSLISGNTKSCGCLQKDVASQYENLTKKRFSRLLVIKEAPRNNHGHIRWECICDCGKEVIVSGLCLRGGHTQSCGCLQREVARKGVLPDGGAAKNKLYGQYKNKAKSRGLYFSLSKEKFLELTQQPCCYCGQLPKSIFRSKKSYYVYNGIDRQNNNIGYILENCVPCCAFCNYAKRLMTVEEFLNWAESVYLTTHHTT